MVIPFLRTPEKLSYKVLICLALINASNADAQSLLDRIEELSKRLACLEQRLESGPTVFNAYMEKTPKPPNTKGLIWSNVGGVTLILKKGGLVQIAYKRTSAYNINGHGNRVHRLVVNKTVIPESISIESAQSQQKISWYVSSSGAGMVDLVPGTYDIVLQTRATGIENKHVGRQGEDLFFYNERANLGADKNPVADWKINTLTIVSADNAAEVLVPKDSNYLVKRLGGQVVCGK